MQIALQGKGKADIKGMCREAEGMGRAPVLLRHGGPHSMEESSSVICSTHALGAKIFLLNPRGRRSLSTVL